MSDPYRSRSGNEEIAPRPDPVVWGDRHGPLEAADVRAFERDGFLVIDGLLAAEVGSLRAEGERIRDSLSTGGGDERWPDDEITTEPDSHTVRSAFRVHRHSAAFRSVASGAKLANVARQILGSEVYVHQSRINYKPGFDGREFDWHSDFETWHVEDGMPRPRAVSASLLLTDNLPINGPLMIIAGSHRLYVRCADPTPAEHYKTSLKKQRYGTPSRVALAELAEHGSIEMATGRAGTVVFFDCNAMHGSAGNLTPYPRNNVFIVFNSVQNSLVAPFGGLPLRPDFLAERDAVPVSLL